MGGRRKGISRAAVIPLLAAVTLAAAQDYSFPSTTGWYSTFVVSAYKDEGAQDWNCGGVYYTGHGGTDFAIYGGFGTMASGVDIVAAADGVVYSSHDGESDTCTTGTCGTANYVILTHADGRRTLYWHMKTWSVAVTAGQTVTCGQKLGEVGSSGNSTGPHLHFEPRTSGNVSLDPFAGSCGASSTSWVSQGGYRSLPGIICGSTDSDGDGHTTTDDCDDGDASIHPGASEYCDGQDEDCNGVVDDNAVDASTFYSDADGDGFGDPASPVRACSQPAGTVTDNTDCNDANYRSHPGAIELCDFDDNDCDGLVDEGYDVDGDGYSSCGGDCDDADATRNAGVIETVDNIDNDCDWKVDEHSHVYDDDSDGWTEDDGDCDDADTFTFPAAPELPDTADNDCDGVIDEGTVNVDDDGDGYSELDGDCDDADASNYPAAPERADGVDGDCDGRVDDGTTRADDDHDGWTEDDGDCDDADRSSFPEALEYVDGADNDCDGSVDNHTEIYDDDGDGFSEAGGDCDDDESAVFPLAPEAANKRDDDCDGIVDNHSVVSDDDHDGWTEEAGDCDDANVRSYPDATEVIDDRDNDCNGLADDTTDAFDDDGDEYSEYLGDCDDTRPNAFPGAPEVVNGADDDCDAIIDNHTDNYDDDQDGWNERQGDCNDTNVHVFPGAGERLSGHDDNCDGLEAAPEGWGAGCATNAKYSGWAGVGAALVMLFWRRR